MRNTIRPAAVTDWSVKFLFYVCDPSPLIWLLIEINKQTKGTLADLGCWPDNIGEAFYQQMTKTIVAMERNQEIKAHYLVILLFFHVSVPQHFLCIMANI